MAQLAPTYNSVVSLASVSTSIPVGALSWSVTCVGATVAVQGNQLPIGATVKGGGYARGSIMTLGAAIPVIISGGGSALIEYDTIAS